ncbi:unannotated protein [freshwater metagenome]|uniref:Unannotated protein n=1 Tax=freshwater metagenome TaxID=449393 RepID=A0A6J6NJE5_9ZZZZ
MERLNILLAEDYQVLREVTDAFLRAAGFSTTVVSSCANAIAALSDPVRPVDVMITDLVMPDGSGFDLANHATFLRPDIRVVVTSGYASAPLVHLPLIEAGYSFLPKPYAKDELLAIVFDALGVAQAA